MDISSLRAGYKSVSHQEAATSEKDDMSYSDEKAMPGLDSEHSNKRHSPRVHLSPFTIENERTFWQKCNSFWVWEITTCIVSLACLGIVLRTLLWIDGKPRARWTLRVEPAAFISIFVTMSRFMMLVGVAEGIGQLRWLYYLGGSRRLDHLDSFDSASRGPWGAVLLMCRVGIKGVAPTIARFGALIMIIALAMDPFAQQILEVKYSDFPSPSDSGAWLLFTNNATANQGNGFFNDDARRRAVYGGLLGYNDNVQFGCTSGNCTWQAFTSLGYNIVCRNASEEVVKTCAAGSGTLGVNCTAIQHSLPRVNMSLTLSNGSISQDLSTNGSRQFSFLKSSTTYAYPLGYKGTTLFSFLIAQLLVKRNDSIFDATDLQNPAWNLTACDVNWSAKLYQNLSVYKGQFIDVPYRDLDLVPIESSNCWNKQPVTCQEFTLSDKTANPQGSSPDYYLDIDTTPVEIRRLLQFNYNLTFSSNEPNVDRTYGSYSLATGLFWNVNITRSFQSSAVSMTDFLRKNSAPQHVNGTVSNITLVMNVRWGWFALPATMNLVGPIFLIFVIIYTAKGVNGERLIWKTNTIPLLMHGLEGYHQHGYAGAETTGAIFSKAREMNVQLRRNEDGEIRFVRT